MAAGNDAHTLHDQAVEKLSELVQERSRLLRKLARMTTAAADIMPETNLVVEFDIARARDLVAQIEELTPEIAAGVVQVNLRARQIGVPQIRWVHLGTGED